MTINDELKKAIKEAKMSISQVAAQMRNERQGTKGVSQQALSDMLRGNIPFTRVQEICGIIGVPLTEIARRCEADSRSDDYSTDKNNSQPSHCDLGRFACPNCGAVYALAPVTAIPAPHNKE